MFASVSIGASRLTSFVFIAIAVVLAAAAPARAGQLGALVSPGALSKAHAALEGGSKCQECHEAGRKVAASRCLVCHKPIAERITARRGVHRNASECVGCHFEHAGSDADLRHIDSRTFNHAAETGFPLDGLHATIAATCTACHKTRSFLSARTTCVSCHADVHNGTLGADCTRCHSVKAAFKQSRAQFDHATSRFALTGAHQRVACEKCHKTKAFKDTAALFRSTEFGACAACHEDPHRKKFGVACTSCHNTAAWDTQRVEHAKTRFPLVGAHGQVACAKCHQSEAMTKPVRFDRCSACHTNVHRQSIKDDCRACHTEVKFAGASFDHRARTSFALEGKHEGLACARCHVSVSPSSVPLARKVVDYGGAERRCVACHSEKDPHKGQFGSACEACHRPATFSVKEFRHPRAPDFYAGQHGLVACEKCHVQSKRRATALDAADAKPAATPSMDCASCHEDVHLGQVGLACERCHAVSGARFAAVNFQHERSRFALTGKHATIDCVKCHRPETRAFPTRTGTAVSFTPTAMECRSCHNDPHLGQVDTRCESCHQTSKFSMSSFVHRGMDDFFGGVHGRYACADCHKKETGVFPAGRGTAIRFQVGRTCASCHRQY